jgi:RNase H-fold protein (predicted Holliday junction resolvase)
VRREKHRAVVDRLAACVILQGYLDALPHEGGNGRTAP